MTIASEITRLQWAKASAKASIEAKWVSVPASAKVDDYHTYIDLIHTWWYFNGVKLKDYLRYGRNSTPTITGYYSWEENEIQYSLILWSQNASSDNARYKYGWVWTKHVSWNDIQYLPADNWSTYSDAHYSSARESYFIKNSTDWIIRWYVRVPTNYSTNRNHIFETVYNYRSWTCTVSFYKWTESYNLADIVTVPDWYTVVSWNSWIKSVTPFKLNNDGYFYITLK